MSLLKWKIATASLFALLCVLPCVAGNRSMIDLDGRWGFRLDPQNIGLNHHWFYPHTSFENTISVPAAWQQQGFGEPSGMLRHQYSGVAWYRKHIDVPANWDGQVVTLRIGGAHRRTRVFVNGIDFGQHDGFNTPFSFDVTRAIKPGRENFLAIRIDNPAPPPTVDPTKQKAILPSGMLNYIANWGGIYGDVALEATDPSHIESILIRSDTEKKVASFHLTIATKKLQPLTVRVGIPGADPVTSAVSPHTAMTAEANIDVALPSAPMWSPDNPTLLTATIELLRDGKAIDSIKKSFGFRQVTTRGNVLLLNGRPIYLRGYGDDNVEVLNGFPPASKDLCLERMKLAKSFGFNAVRFHSMTPPECYFDAADQVGILIMAELPAAYTQFFFGQRDFLREELKRTLLAYRNHPSLLSLAFGNEFNMEWLKTDAERESMQQSIGEFYDIAKQLAPATLIMSNDGFDIRPTDMVSMFDPKPLDRPTVLHEFGDYYDSLPDIESIPKFTGVIHPDWLENKKQWVTSNKLLESYPAYLRNSKELQQIGRKFQIEQARAKNWVTGYDYWLLVDYPAGSGEGDAWEEGWFDYFWCPKVSSEQGRELNSPVLLMIDAGLEERALRNGIERKIKVSISNYGHDAINNGVLSWKLKSDGQDVDTGEISEVNIALGAVAYAGEIVLHAPAGEQPHNLQLIVNMKAQAQTFSNRWSFWSFPETHVAASAAKPVVVTADLSALRQIYPSLGLMPESISAQTVLITSRMTEATRTHLRRGGRVIWMLPSLPNTKGVSFLPDSGGAVGTLISKSGPLEKFPNEGFCDLQCFNLLDGATPVSLDAWATGLAPILGAIRTRSAFLSTQKDLSRVGYIIEVNAGGGKLLITAPNMWKRLDSAHPEVNYIFEQLLLYASSVSFAPDVTIPETLLNSLQTEH